MTDDDKRRVLDRLQQIAAKSGPRFDKEYRIHGSASTVDTVWLKDIAGLDAIPVGAFEIEASEQIPKHVRAVSSI